MDTIPPITHPWGRIWKQPATSEILLNEVAAAMTRNTFDKLLDYTHDELLDFTHSQPTGCYEGKMWKIKCKDKWYLCWFGISRSGDPDTCSTYMREILFKL